MPYVWLVEDSLHQLEELSKLFRDDLGLSVEPFRNASDLLTKIAALPRPDAIILDLALIGNMNGFQLGLEILRQRGDITPQQFCFLSGWSQQFKEIAPAEFQKNRLVDKGDWTLDQLQSALEEAKNESNKPKTS